MDFEADVRAGLLAWFTEQGFTVKSKGAATAAAIFTNPNPMIGVPPADDLVFAYFNLMRRNIAPRPRATILSKEFTASLARLSADEQAAWSTIESRSREGRSLESSLSRHFEDLYYDDDLLNDWCIHHIHLGKPVPRTGTPRHYAERNSMVAFCYVRDDRLYCIDINGHKDHLGPTWEDTELLEVVHANWRGLWRISGIPGGDPVSRTEVREARKNGVNALVTLRDGTIYHPPGGGIASNGQSGDVRFQADCFWDAVRAEENKRVGTGAKLVIKGGGPLLQFWIQES